MYESSSAEQNQGTGPVLSSETNIAPSPPVLCNHKASSPPHSSQPQEAVNFNSYFGTLRAFSSSCRRDSKLTPAAQLLFRLLIEEANSSFWQQSFVCTIDYLEDISHLSRPTIIDARRILKNRGFISFTGKPSRYTVYSLLNQEFNHKVNHSKTPQTPQFNTYKTLNNTLKKKSKKERAIDHAPHQPATAEIVAEAKQLQQELIRQAEERRRN